MGNHEDSLGFREKLVHDLDDFRSNLFNITESYSNCLTQYQTTMGKAIKEVVTYFNHTDLEKMHSKSKREALAQVWMLNRFYATISVLVLISQFSLASPGCSTANERIAGNFLAQGRCRYWRTSARFWEWQSKETNETHGTLKCC